MDALDQFRASGAYADVFSGFEEPSKYWVRSSKPRMDKRFPTKPIVGFLLGKPANALTGGWSQPHDAAARLHAAGYIIVDQNDEPLPLPEQYTHLMRGAERARLVALNYFIEPAREAGVPSVTIRAGDLHDMCGLVRNWANVCQALEGEMFQKFATVPEPTRSGPERSTTTEYTFVLARDGAAKDGIMPHAVQTATTNLILYGPPGTGKTYQTAWEAVRLCLGEEVADKLIGEEHRKQLMAEYQSLMKEERIEFVTFHQSMSYEEFVEGLQPSTGDDAREGPEELGAGVGFRLKPTEGVFKRISERARLDSSQAGTVSRLDRNARVFKVALGRRQVEEYRIRFGLDNGLIHVGWGGDIDWSDERFDDFNQIFNEWRSHKDAEATGHDGNIVVTYSFRSDMQIGDYVVVSDGRDRIKAFGKITGDYYYDGDAEFHPHRRTVDWIWRDEVGTDRGRFYPNAFRRHSVYKLNQSLIDWDALEEVVFGKRAAVADNSARDHVLIIDEINRANISKVFGELITLLEPDKRLGRRDEIQLTLPYSKKRFGVPPNLHIIGTMNTADRSIALLDTALRRRFTFKELMPDPSFLSPNIGGINLQKLLATINERIEYLFDREHQIGHAYFTGCTSPEAVEDVMRHKVIPLLAEYFYEDWAKVAAVLGDSPNAKAARFLEAIPWKKSVITGDDLTGERLRWRVKDQFDFSEFKD
ncbi:ATPase [Tabrizicola piscis]|uniref:ATPase n=2 Tax=Tabrizicola piscis TaxID=2494374 RepID=A0A3S8UBR1_9RHOB|nr:ATPase [Tabrizicola piscis]